MSKPKEDCVMYADEMLGCVALKKTECNGCRFYISRAEYERRNGMSYEMALHLAEGYINPNKE